MRARSHIVLKSAILRQSANGMTHPADRGTRRVLNLAGAPTLCDHREHCSEDPVLTSALELRYQVYCVEYGFLPPDDYPDGLETDVHDKRAAHFYVFDSNEELVGYARLVRPDTERLFPIQKYCATVLEGVKLPIPSQTAEISRLMVRSDYRRRRADRPSGVMAEQCNPPVAGDRRVTGDRRCEAPQILFDLYRQMYTYSRAHGIRYWYAAMELPLARSLLRMNFRFTPIGPQADYFGQVTPYLADLRELESQLGDRDPALLAWLQYPDMRFGKTTPGDGWDRPRMDRAPHPSRRTAKLPSDDILLHAVS